VNRLLLRGRRDSDDVGVGVGVGAALLVPAQAMADDEFPPGYDFMEEKGKKYIWTPLLDSQGNDNKILKIFCLCDLALQHGKSTPGHPNGRFLDLNMERVDKIIELVGKAKPALRIEMTFRRANLAQRLKDKQTACCRFEEALYMAWRESAVEDAHVAAQYSTYLLVSGGDGLQLRQGA
jgi:hypothetical protein